mmetsp:Transcript_27199/g.63322  ORF Transcript_27199/g.63322 Transcript_27199/m.63322 type:complete len:873 (-) Transcript_27199:111-2729(-)
MTLGSGVLGGSSSVGTLGHAVSTSSGSLMTSQHVNEATFHLQKQYNEESSARDAAKLGLVRLRQTVEFNRRRLQTILTQSSGIGSVTTPHVKQLLRDMESEVKDAWTGRGLVATQSATAPQASMSSPPRNYEVLRQSLYEAQRRCESLNTDMVHQNEAYGELVETLSTVKDANRRLVEQIRTQTAEIEQLTEQRVSDEDRMDQMLRKHERDRDTARNEAQRQAELAREQVEAAHKKVHMSLLEKQRRVQASVANLTQDCGRLQREVQDRRQEIVELTAPFLGEMQTAVAEATTRCVQFLGKHNEKKQAAEDAIGDLNVKLQAEREARQSENLSWGHRVGLLTAKVDGLQECLERDTLQLNAHLQAVDRALLQERKGSIEDKVVTEGRQKQQVQQQSNLQAALDPMQQEAMSLETQVTGTQTEVQAIEQEIVGLLQQVRVSDDVLAAAVSSNEHLRHQLEEQRERSQEKNSADLEECRGFYEQKLAEQQRSLQADCRLMLRQAEGMEQDERSQLEAIIQLRTRSEGLGAECSQLEADAVSWRSTTRHESQLREDQEKVILDVKQQYEAQRLQLQASVDLLSSKLTSMEEECRLIGGETSQLQRTFAAKLAEDTARQDLAEKKLKEGLEALKLAKARLQDAGNKHAMVANEAAVSKDRALQMQATLERKREDMVMRVSHERQRLKELLTQESEALTKARSDFEAERAYTFTELRQLHDDSYTKLAGAERERAKMEDDYRKDVQSCWQASQQMQRRCETLERDLARVKVLLQESESNHDWVRKESERAAAEVHGSLRSVEAEVRQATESVEAARQEESAIAQQLEAQQVQNAQDKRQLLQSLEEITATGVAHVARALANSRSPTRSPQRSSPRLV